MNTNIILQQDELLQGLDKLWNKLHGIEEHDGLNHWEWVQGVALYGVIKAYEETGQNRYGAFLQQWAADHAHSIRHGSVNWVAPANALLSAYQETGDPELGKLCREVADYSVHEALRTTNGGFAHVWGPGAGGLDDYRNQLWIDTLFMAGIYILRFGLFDQNRTCLEEALHQFDIHIDCQFDPDRGLFAHGYHCLDKTPLGEHWGRGNGWAAVSVIELLGLMKGQPYATTRYEEVFKRQMESVYRLRMKDGMLRTLLDVEESYLETSASALFAYAALKGYRLGILDEKFRSWGIEITGELLAKHLAEDGTVLHASGGTDCQDAAGYLRVPYAPRQYSTGIGMMLFRVLLPGEAVSLQDEAGTGVPVQTRINAYWPDGSVKWLLHSGLLDTRKTFTMEKGKGTAAEAGITASQAPDGSVTIESDQLSCRIQPGSRLISSMLRKKSSHKPVSAQLTALIENRDGQDGIETISIHTLHGVTDKITLEEAGPLRAVVKLEGTHQYKNRDAALFPFVIRLYVYAGSDEIRMVHSFAFDADENTDYLKGLAVHFHMEATGELWNRHVGFTGDTGMFYEAVQPMYTYSGTAHPLYEQQQIDGQFVHIDHVTESGLLENVQDNAAWANFRLQQDSCDHYSIVKSTNRRCAYIPAAQGNRSKGAAFFGDK
ncbi:hypothetical protein KC345_g10286, partial [Hortaea werneckii]